MAKRPTLYPDADLRNADWTKQTWDIPASNLKELRRYLKHSGTTPEAFKRLPVYRYNVRSMPWLKDL